MKTIDCKKIEPRRNEEHEGRSGFGFRLSGFRPPTTDHRPPTSLRALRALRGETTFLGSRIIALMGLCLLASASVFGQIKAKPFLASELIFPLEHWHNHASCIVEAPNGDLLVCWFHGSGERQADDVIVEGARKKKGAQQWSPRFTMADTPGYPDTNCTMFVDPQGRLWLMWPTIMANLWESALM